MLSTKGLLIYSFLIAVALYETNGQYDGSPFQCPRSFGSFPDLAACNAYYVCSHNKPTRFQCPPTLWYAAFLKQCDTPQNVLRQPNLSPDSIDYASCSVKSSGRVEPGWSQKPQIATSPRTEYFNYGQTGQQLPNKRNRYQDCVAQCSVM